MRSRLLPSLLVNLLLVQNVSVSCFGSPTERVAHATSWTTEALFQPEVAGFHSLITKMDVHVLRWGGQRLRVSLDDSQFRYAIGLLALAGLSAFAPTFVATVCSAYGVAAVFGSRFKPYLYAHELWNAGRTDEAVKILSEYLQRESDDYKAWKLLARCALELNDFEGALRAARHALQGRPEDAALRGLTGRIYAAMGEYSNAIDQAQLETTLDPRFPDGWLALAQYAEADGNDELALKAQLAASRMLPRSSTLRTFIAQLVDRLPPEAALFYLTEHVRLRPRDAFARMLAFDMTVLVKGPEAASVMAEQWSREAAGHPLAQLAASLAEVLQSKRRFSSRGFRKQFDGLHKAWRLRFESRFQGPDAPYKAAIRRFS
jgi:tetratricopeptide (TPR) repeat protein